MAKHAFQADQPDDVGAGSRLTHRKWMNEQVDESERGERRCDQAERADARS